MLAVQNESGALFRYRFGDIEFDEARFELRVREETIEVQPKPLALLALLLRTPGEVVTSEEILQTVWKYQNTSDLETNVIGTALTKLRTALGKDARRIVNLPRVGYRFEGRVERVVVGRTLSSGLSLETGMQVPLRDNFLLSELLCRSRFSEVWRARHAKTDEPRIYKFSPAGDRLPALKREATLYRLLHDTLGERPDIVRVIDWNFSEAPFFLECEDGGQNLRQWAEENGRLAGLDLPARLALFLQIADAVSAAHGVGVLHKDLKPDNILVAPRGEGWQVRLTDFGSGLLLEPARLEDLGITRLGFTATQGVLGEATSGTLLYLAPELVRGETPTVQSDVYALGLLLFQLVVGEMRRPLVPGWQREIPDELLQQDIAAATDGNPAHRLHSVGELAASLRRQAERRAELARQRALEEAARQAQEALKRSRARRPWMVGLVASLGLGFVISAGLYYRSQQAYRTAEAQRNRAEAINQFLNDDLIGAADPGAPGAERDPSVKTLLARAAGRLESRFSSDPVTKASLDLSIGKAYFGLGDYTNAAGFQRRGVTQLTAAMGTHAEEVLEAQYMLALTLVQQEQFEEANRLLGQADATLAGTAHPAATLNLLSAWSRSSYYQKQMQPAAALSYAEQAERIRAEAVPGDATWLYRVRGTMAWCYVRMGRNTDAIAALGELTQPQYSMERMGIAAWLKMRLQYALALSNESRFDEAEATLKETLASTRSLLGDDHYATALVWNHLGAVDQNAGRWEEAIAAQTQAYSGMCRAIGCDSPTTLKVRSELAIVQYLGGHNAEALPLLRDLHGVLARQGGEQAPWTQDTAFYLASALLASGQTEEAAKLAAPLQAVALNSIDPGPDWEQRIDGLRGAILVRQGRVEQGQPLLSRALEQMQQDHAPAWMPASLRALAPNTVAPAPS